MLVTSSSKNVICLWGPARITDLANETKKSKHCLSYYGRNSDSLLIVSQRDSEQAGLQEPSNTTPQKPFHVLKAFWSTVKDGRKSDYDIKKVYITGVTPLLSDFTSGVNDHENISPSPQISTICGLTRSDVLGALKAICHRVQEPPNLLLGIHRRNEYR
jgi:Predicted AAA-ATPase